ncbi:DMT family transporter [Deinococcus sp. UYEF24]
MNALLLVLGILSNAGASLLIKLANSPGGGLSGMLLRPALWGSLVLYGSAFVLYALALQRLPLGIAQPLLTGGALMTVTLASVWWLHEPLTPARMGGTVLVLIGAVLLSLPAAR